jgi:hypothetical protein
MFKKNLLRVSRRKFAPREFETGTARATLGARSVELDRIRRRWVKILLVASGISQLSEGCLYRSRTTHIGKLAGLTAAHDNGQIHAVLL